MGLCFQHSFIHSFIDYLFIYYLFIYLFIYLFTSIREFINLPGLEVKRSAARFVAQLPSASLGAKMKTKASESDYPLVECLRHRKSSDTEVGVSIFVNEYEQRGIYKSAYV